MERPNIRHINRLLTYAICLIYVMTTSCENNDEPDNYTDNTDKTVFIYMPWSSNLTNYFYQNINDIETAICNMDGLKKEKAIVFISTSSREATMFEIVYSNGRCSRKQLKEYHDPAITTEQGISSILNDVKTFSPAKKYAMIIGCHGMGWIPVNPSRALFTDSSEFHYNYSNTFLTRFFGGTTKEYQTDISTLANAILDAGMKMEFILFDDCYMATVEVAYELKDATDYLIASTCEVMAYGMPYATMGKHLFGNPDYRAICDEFYEFYSNYEMPCGTLSVTDCSEMENLGTLMKQINSDYTFDQSMANRIQKLDGYSPAIFFDFGSYVELMLTSGNADNSTIVNFNRQLELTVPYKTHTEEYYSAIAGAIPIHTYSGITTSDPSTNSMASDKTTTAWYHATH